MVTFIVFANELLDLKLKKSHHLVSQKLKNYNNELKL